MSRPHLLLPLVVLSLRVACQGDAVSGLSCWHCIADNCDEDPSSNYKAWKVSCEPGQQCQKTFYEMRNEKSEKTYMSIVRSCAECYPQDDFVNCTHDLHTTRGCVRRHCCDDRDLCNAAVTSRADVTPIALGLAACLLRCLLR